MRSIAKTNCHGGKIREILDKEKKKLNLPVIENLIDERTRLSTTINSIKREIISKRGHSES